MDVCHDAEAHAAVAARVQGLRDGQGMCAEARELLHEVLVSEGLSPGRIFSATERLWTYNYRSSQASMTEKIIGLMLGGDRCYRVIEEDVQDGLQCVFFSWDEVKEAPYTTTVRDGDEYVILCVIKFVFVREVRRWHLMASDFMPLPLGWLTTTATLAMPFVRLATACMQLGYRRIGQKLCSTIAQRTALSAERLAWQAVCT